MNQVYLPAQAAIKNTIDRSGGVCLNISLYSHSSGGCQIQIKEPMWFLVGDFFLAYRWPPPHCVLLWKKERERDILFFTGTQI